MNTTFFAIALPTYCERVHSGWLGEPLNLITNVSYIVAAVLAYKKVKSTDTKFQTYLYFLISIIAAIGLGSAIFHAVPSRATIFFDAVPIYIFLLAALALLVKCLASSWKTAIIAISLYGIALIAATVLVPDSFLNGSSRHIITFFSLVIILYYTAKLRNKSEGDLLLVILLLYAVAIGFRTIDNTVCGSHHIGTHFLWHILNAVAAYFAIVLLVHLNKTVAQSNL